MSATQTSGPTGGGRPGWLIPAIVGAVVVIAVIVVIAIVASNDDDGDSSATPSTTTTTQSTTTTVASSTTSEGTPAGPAVRLVTDEIDEIFEVTKCENPGETDISLEAQTDDVEDPVVLKMDATGGTGSIELSGPTEAEGTVDSLMVGDTGEITASGELSSTGDDAGEPTTWELTGNCV